MLTSHSMPHSIPLTSQCHNVILGSFQAEVSFHEYFERLGQNPGEKRTFAIARDEHLRLAPLIFTTLLDLPAKNLVFPRFYALSPEDPRPRFPPQMPKAVPFCRAYTQKFSKPPA